MKIKQLIEELGLFVDYEKSLCNPNDNISFYYLKDNILTNCQFESFFDCNYVDINDNVDYEFTIQDTNEIMEDLKNDSK